MIESQCTLDLPTRVIALRGGTAYEYRFAPYDNQRVTNPNKLVLESKSLEQWYVVGDITPAGFGLEGLVNLAILLDETETFLAEDAEPHVRRGASQCATCQSVANEDCGVCRALAVANLS